jgi:hypothetical protein
MSLVLVTFFSYFVLFLQTDPIPARLKRQLSSNDIANDFRFFNDGNACQRERDEDATVKGNIGTFGARETLKVTVGDSEACDDF